MTVGMPGYCGGVAGAGCVACGDGAACVAGFVLASLLLRPLYLRMVTGRFRRRRTALGLPDHAPVRAYPDDDAFHYACGGSRCQLDWAVITEIFPLSGYWVVTADSTPSYIPRRFFADQQAEQTFVAEVLKRMSPESRARSAKARAFSRYD